MRGLTLFFILLNGLVSFASEEGIFIKEFRFDPQSKEFELSYLNSDQTNLSVLKTTSPIYLCLVNQLLHEYYQSFEPVGNKHIQFSREHLKLIHQVAHIVPENEKEELINAIKNYIKQFDNNGNVIFQALGDSITYLLKNETLKIKEETLDSKERKTSIEREIKTLNDQIDQAKTSDQEQKPTLKKIPAPFEWAQGGGGLSVKRTILISIV